eukprot:PhM_4_TR16912/c0_g1_i1/m.82733
MFLFFLQLVGCVLDGIGWSRVRNKNLATNMSLLLVAQRLTDIVEAQRRRHIRRQAAVHQHSVDLRSSVHKVSKGIGAQQVARDEDVVVCQTVEEVTVVRQRRDRRRNVADLAAELEALLRDGGLGLRQHLEDVVAALVAREAHNLLLHILVLVVNHKGAMAGAAETRDVVAGRRRDDLAAGLGGHLRGVVPDTAGASGDVDCLAGLNAQALEEGLIRRPRGAWADGSRCVRHAIGDLVGSGAVDQGVVSEGTEVLEDVAEEVHAITNLVGRDSAANGINNTGAVHAEHSGEAAEPAEVHVLPIDGVNGGGGETHAELVGIGVRDLDEAGLDVIEGASSVADPRTHSAGTGCRCDLDTGHLF